ncbi:MAG: DegV family protein [Candidatus Dormibacteria bacterium]
MTRIVVDSTCDLPAATMKEMNVLMVPLKVHFGDRVFRDKVELDDQAFFEMLESATELPTTSQPSPGDFLEAYRQVPEGETILSIHIAEQLSGTQQSARLAARELPDRDIRIIDSGNVTAAAGLLVTLAAEMIAEGQGADAIVARIEEVRPRVRLLAILDTLKYVVMGGRVGRLQGTIGGLLRVKPLMLVLEGEIHRLAPARTWGQAYQRVVEDIRAHGGAERIAVIDARAPENREGLRRVLAEEFPGVPLTEGGIGAVIGTHGGPGAAACAYIAKQAG